MFLKLPSHIVGKLSPNIVKYCHLLPSGNRALLTTNLCFYFKISISGESWTGIANISGYERGFLWHT